MKNTLETVKNAIRNNISAITLFTMAAVAVIFSSFSPVIMNSAPATDSEAISAAQLTAYTEDALEMDAGDAVDELIGLCFDGLQFAEDKEDAMLANKDLVRGGYAKSEYSVCA